MINIAFRFDDPSVSSNHMLESEVINICSEYGVKINFAVIPFKKINHQLIPLTSLSAKHLAEAEAKDWIEISQHGHSHQKYKSFDKGPSEFQGRPYEEQLHLLNAGKNLLDEIFRVRKRGFVPPWNTFDNNTVLAANQLDFNFISAGWEIPNINKPEKIKLIPRTGQVSELIKDAKRFKPYSAISPIIVSVIHHYDFVESNEDGAKFDLKGFEEIIKSITSMKHIKVSSLESIANNLNPNNTRFGHITHKILTQKFNWRIKKHLPTSIFFHNSFKNNS